MTDDTKAELVERLVNKIPELTSGQLYWLQRVVKSFSSAHTYKLLESDIFDENSLTSLGDAMRIHHCFSAEPFSKDKFEYVLVKIMNMNGHAAQLAPKGNPGHDATLDGVKLSLKTQADKGIKKDFLWVSKFMELGKGNWGNDPEDLKGLLNQFFNHLSNYDRILSLRNLHVGPDWSYEIVEIPKSVLSLANTGTLEMKNNSRVMPKPGNCYVRSPNGEAIFNLYFDGGGERKLQIKNLSKKYCTVHATLDFFIPPED